MQATQRLEAHLQDFSSAGARIADAAAIAEADRLPLDTRFTLGAELTAVQKAFFDKHGFILFAKVASQAELDAIYAEICRIQDVWLAERRQKVFGIPLFVGKDHAGQPFIQRFAFTSMFSDVIRDFVRDARFEPVRRLVGDAARVGDNEKDGVVFNRNLNVPGTTYKSLGWHTDGLRDLFYGRGIRPQLNVGLHFDRCTKASGGLRILPGTHKQGLVSTLFRKPYFVNNTPDPAEIAIETEPGDLTVHDGQAWHRVERSDKVGPESLRRTMYVPYLTDAYQPKDESSPTPPYHYLGMALRKAKMVRAEIKKRLGR
ncbi:MAG: phytanoyl-CoA dioxygenase family protein [Deltaproteobacteria bacterium]|nr:phytanoyl-CoA dioxygenase family protein [Deltaproteobacteria bacterium]